jgi:hypothetical protein
MDIIVVMVNLLLVSLEKPRRRQPVTAETMA